MSYSIRVWSRGATFLVLVVLSPIFILVSLALLATQGRPIFYTGKRMGKDGKIFTLYKFRTMKIDAEHELEGVVCTQVSPLTNLGRVLRSCRLDELPQFWNIVNGSMKWFGPRPMRKSVYDQNRADIPNYYIKRLYRTPGLFGPVQVYLPHGTHKRYRFLFFCLTFLGPREWTFRRQCVLILTASVALMGKSCKQFADTAHRFKHARTLTDRRQGTRVTPRYPSHLCNEKTGEQWVIVEADEHMLILESHNSSGIPEKGVIRISVPGKKTGAVKHVFCQCKPAALTIAGRDNIVGVHYVPLSEASRFFLERYLLRKTIC